MLQLKLFSRKPMAYPKVMIWPDDMVVATRAMKSDNAWHDDITEGATGRVVSVVWLIDTVSYTVDFNGVDGDGRETGRRNCGPDDVGLVLEER